MTGTFLLGLGAQKAGTAWMHRYLESSPQCDPGFRKEYHVWDAVDLPSGRVVRERIERQGGDRARFLVDPEQEGADGHDRPPYVVPRGWLVPTNPEERVRRPRG